MLIGACGDGADPEIAPPTGRPASASPTSVQPSGMYVTPCEPNEFVKTTPRLPHEVKVTHDDSFISITGVDIDACMGLTGQEKKGATEILGNGVQTWMMAEYPQGTTVKNQEEFESEVCAEIARLITVEPTLSQVSWVSLTTFGTFIIGFSGSTGPTPTMPLDQEGNYIPPSCPLPKRGPTA